MHSNGDLHFLSSNQHHQHKEKKICFPFDFKVSYIFIYLRYFEKVFKYLAIKKTIGSADDPFQWKSSIIFSFALQQK